MYQASLDRWHDVSVDTSCQGRGRPSALGAKVLLHGEHLVPLPPTVVDRLRSDQAAEERDGQVEAKRNAERQQRLLEGDEDRSEPVPRAMACKPRSSLRQVGP